MSVPQSVINICSGVLLTNDYLHTIYFEDSSKQLAYFTGKVVKTFSAYTYLRKEWDIKVDATMEEARTWSYLFFRNNTGKYYYYFINNIQYENENTVTLKLELDVMQTYLNEYVLHPCFVEREHAATDEAGDNIIDEGLDLGQFVVNQKSNMDMQELCIMILSSFDPEDTTENTTATVLAAKYNNVYSGLGVYAVDMSKYIEWGARLKDFDNWGKSEGILNMWVYPKKLVTLATGQSWSDSQSLVKKVGGATTFSHQISRSSSMIDDYIPRNRKLYTFPYNFLYVSNNSGGGAVYHYEKFTDPQACQFRVAGSLSPEGSVKLYPISYQNVAINYDEGLSGGDYPTCAWNQDIYKLWLAQNQHQQSLSMLSAGLTVAAGVGSAIMTGGAGAAVGLSAASHGASQIASLLSQRADKEIQPPQAKGSYSSSVNIATEHQTFTFMKKSIDRQHAMIIDDYFDLYGYKTNRVKVPNRKVRENWTYTKTIGCHVSGNFCTEDLRKIQSIYDNGVTFWVNGDRIGSYGLTNYTL